MLRHNMWTTFLIAIGGLSWGLNIGIAMELSQVLSLNKGYIDLQYYDTLHRFPPY